MTKQKKTYEKPPIALGEKYTKLEIKDKLVDYNPVNDIKELEVGAQIKYFKRQEDGTLKFCDGGIIVNNSGLPTYIMVMNGTLSWSVQMIECTIFRKRTWQDSKIEELEEKLKKVHK